MTTPPLEELAHQLPDELVEKLDELAGKDEPAVPTSVAQGLLAQADNPCERAAPQSRDARIDVTRANLDNDEAQELIVVLGPICEPSQRSLIVVVDRDRGRRFVRATRAEVIRWPDLVSVAGPTFEVYRRVFGPRWSTRTWEPLRLRLKDNRLEPVATSRPDPQKVPVGLAKRLETRRKSRRERAAMLAELAAFIGPDACGSDVDPGEDRPAPTVRVSAVNLDTDPARELVVFAPELCDAPHGGGGGLFLFDQVGDDLLLADTRFASFHDGVFYASAKSKTVFVQESTGWGSALHRNALVALRIAEGRLKTAFSIPGAYDFSELSPLQDLTFRFAPSGADFVAHYRGQVATVDITEWFPALAGTVLDRDEPYPILSFRSRVLYRWKDRAGRYDRTSATRVSAEDIELFTAHGMQAPEDGKPWLAAFLPELKRRARTDRGTKLFVRHLEASWRGS